VNQSQDTRCRRLAFGGVYSGVPLDNIHTDYLCFLLIFQQRQQIAERRRSVFT
jgi:hypothetical protein